MTEGKRKSVEIAGCVLGERTTTPSLKIKKGTDVEALCRAMLYFTPTAHCVSVKYSLNKPVIIGELRKPVGFLQEQLICEFGLAVAQREEFFIDRARRDVAPADPEIVKGDAA